MKTNEKSKNKLTIEYNKNEIKKRLAERLMGIIGRLKRTNGQYVQVNRKSSSK